MECVPNSFLGARAPLQLLMVKKKSTKKFENGYNLLYLASSSKWDSWVLQGCVDIIFRVYQGSRVFHGCLMGFSRVFCGWIKGVSRGVNGFPCVFRGVTGLFWQHVQYISRLFHWCFVGVSRVFQGCRKDVAFLFQRWFKGVWIVFWRS